MAKLTDYVVTDEVVAIRYLAKIKYAKEKGIEFNLTLGDYKRLQNTKRCFYSKVPLYRGQTHGPLSFNCFTLDRIDNKQGYIKGNVVASCYGVNQVKAAMEADHIKFDINSLEYVVSQMKMVKALKKLKI